MEQSYTDKIALTCLLLFKSTDHTRLVRPLSYYTLIYSYTHVMLTKLTMVEISVGLQTRLAILRVVTANHHLDKGQ